MSDVNQWVYVERLSMYSSNLENFVYDANDAECILNELFGNDPLSLLQ